MMRLFNEFAYSDVPRAGCWWDITNDIPTFQPVAGVVRTDVAIIGAGFTGLSAAMHLARAGVNATVLEAKRVGWGASGRNGGFCCLGGGKASDASLDRRFGKAGRLDFRQAELTAVQLVKKLITENNMEVDRHSIGETALAHRPKDMAAFESDVHRVRENYGVPCHLHPKSDLKDLGMAGPFHGGMTIEAGFGLNPRKYIAGLARETLAAGGLIYESSAVSKIEKQGDSWLLDVAGHSVHADRVIVATNGYSSENLPDWLAGRYLPTQSNVIVTRPLTDQELGEAGWTSDQMSYDSRNLLHYFRLLPDRRFLFGMRGGLLTGTRAEARSAGKVRQDFNTMFPAWQNVEIAHGWSGLVSLARDLLPFVGAVPNQEGLFAGLCYHGNGVAMGSYSGAILAQLVQGKEPDGVYPDAMREPLRRFELGRWRRAALPFAYAGLMLADL